MKREKAFPPSSDRPAASERWRGEPKNAVHSGSSTPLFVDGVRSNEKKEIIETVHREFVAQSEAAGMTVRYANFDRKAMLAALDRGAVPVVLISTYRLNQRKIPHWVVVSGNDERCFYVHDPNAADRNEKAVDCQFIPIVQEDFDPMSSFGGNRLRTAIILSRKGGADA